jgi:hypothetical protein
MKHLEGRLQKSFDTLASEGIDSILLRIPEDSPESMDCLRGALRVLSCYRPAAEKNSPITYSRNGKPMQLTAVRDDQGQPDPNLTMLAAVNDLSTGAMEDMVRKVSAFMQRPENARLRRQFPNIYQTFFAIKGLRDKLQRPPIEVNARRKSTDTPADEPAWGGGPGWVDGTGTAAAGLGAPGGGAGGSIGGGTGGGASSGTGGEAGSHPSPDGPTAVMGDAVFREGLTRLLKDTFKDAPAAAAGTMRCVYGQDYGSLDAGSLGERLGLITNLLTAMQVNPAGQQLMETALQRVQAGMDQLPNELLNDLVIDNNVVKVWEGDRERIVGKVEKKLAQAIDTQGPRRRPPEAAGHGVTNRSISRAMPPPWPPSSTWRLRKWRPSSNCSAAASTVAGDSRGPASKRRSRSLPAITRKSSRCCGSFSRTCRAAATACRS